MLCLLLLLLFVCFFRKTISLEFHCTHPKLPWRKILRKLFWPTLVKNLQRPGWPAKDAYIRKIRINYCLFSSMDKHIWVESRHKKLETACGFYWQYNLITLMSYFHCSNCQTCLSLCIVHKQILESHSGIDKHTQKNFINKIKHSRHDNNHACSFHLN